MKLIPLMLCAAASLFSQALSPRWEELTAADFEKAVAATAQNTPACCPSESSKSMDRISRSATT